MDEQTSLLANENQPLNRPLIEHAESKGSGFEATINCQVCNAIVPLGNKEKQLVVKCPVCNEATPIKGPPPGKQYVRCPCNCLLICKASTTRVGCPRPQCQRVISLPGVTSECVGQSNLENMPTDGGTFPSRSGTIRLTCGNCHRPFSIPSPQPSYTNDGSCINRMISCLSGGSARNSNFLIAARCPQCRKVTSVGPAYARVRWVSYFVFTILMLVVSVAVTAGTVIVATSNNALYFLWSVLYLLLLICLVRFVMFFRMSVSALEVSVSHNLPPSLA